MCVCVCVCVLLNSHYIDSNIYHINLFLVGPPSLPSSPFPKFCIFSTLIKDEKIITSTIVCLFVQEKKERIIEGYIKRLLVIIIIIVVIFIIVFSLIYQAKERKEK